MKIEIEHEGSCLGATGGTGRLIVRDALSKGHSVVALVGRRKLVSFARRLTHSGKRTVANGRLGSAVLRPRRSMIRSAFGAARLDSDGGRGIENFDVSCCDLFIRVEPVAPGGVGASTHRVMLMRRQRRSQFNQSTGRHRLPPLFEVNNSPRPSPPRQMPSVPLEANCDQCLRRSSGVHICPKIFRHSPTARDGARHWRRLPW
jgi:hypothetical protein